MYDVSVYSYMIVNMYMIGIQLYVCIWYNSLTLLMFMNVTYIIATLCILIIS